MSKLTDFNTTQKNTWCAGCGNFGIWSGVKQAYVDLNIDPHEVANVFDIGCNGNGCNWFRCYAFHSLHGRVLPVALGIRLANPKLKVMAFSGDGGALGEGGNHFMHTCRTNIDMTYVIHNNQLYSLTTGQMSPESAQGMKTKSSPQGNPMVQLNHLQIAISAGATFVARAYAFDTKELTRILKAAIEHKGFSVVDVLQPCVTLNLVNTSSWYTEHMKKLDDTWDPTNKEKAIQITGSWDNGIPVGIIYKEERPTLEEKYGLMEKVSLVDQVKQYDVKELLKEFA